MMQVRVLVVLSIIDVSILYSISPGGGGDVLGEASQAVGAVLEAASQPRCSVILLTDGTTPPNTVFKLMGQKRAPLGGGVFETTAGGLDDNMTQVHSCRSVNKAEQLRQLSWCVTVLVVSDDPAFLAAFARCSLRTRLVGWSTRLFALTRLPLPEVEDLLTNQYTYSMMNAMFLIFDDTSVNNSCVMYCHMPYGPRGAETVRVASWTSHRGLTVFPNQRLYPEKFSNFQGAIVNVTGLPWPPFFIEYKERTAAGITSNSYKGPDGLLFLTLAKTLNFTYHFLPVSDWAEAADRVVERKAIMCVVSHVMLHTRYKRYDYTYSYTFASFGFGMAKPLLKPQWQSLYYPLADEVWASTLAALLLMPGFMYMISISNHWMRLGRIRGPGIFSPGLGGRGIGAMIQEALGTLLGQNISQWLPRASSSRVLVAAWLVFAFIIGTVYRGNLTAALTLPKYPPRPETVEELVNYVDRVTMASYGTEWRKQFRESGSPTLEKLANLIYIGPTILEGLQQALKTRQAHLTTRQVFNHWTAKHLTRADGSTPLYFGREDIVPGATAWPVPHDAPYKPQVDRVIMAVREAGLYDKWAEDTVEETRRDSRVKKRERQEEDARGTDHALESTSSSSSTTTSRALTIVHMQGPLMLLLLGLVVACTILATEIITSECCR